MPTAEKSSSKDKLIALVEKLRVEEPYEYDGFVWAARPQAFYATELDVCTKTIGEWIKETPFVKRPKIICEKKVTVTGEDVEVEGGTKVTLLRLGDPANKGPDECAHIMRGVWKNKIGRKLSEHQKQCLWGFAKDMLKHFPGINPVHVFVYAIDHWPDAASCIKIAEEAEPGYKVEFKEFPASRPFCAGTRPWCTPT